MSEESLKVLRRAFREYYFQRNSIEIPSRIEEREFGYLPFGGFMTRHRSGADPLENLEEEIQG